MPILSPHFPPRILKEDDVTQSFCEGLVVARVCVQQVPDHLHCPTAQVPDLDQVLL